MGKIKQFSETLLAALSVRNMNSTNYMETWNGDCGSEQMTCHLEAGLPEKEVDI